MIDVAIERWKLEGLELLPPLDQLVVEAKLNSLGLPYSRDVLALFLSTGGMEDGEEDSHMWTLWHLDRVIRETVSYGKPYILFADFLIGSHLYCFKYENEAVSSVGVDYVNGDEPELVARSVEEFFMLLESDAGKLRMFE